MDDPAGFKTEPTQIPHLIQILPQFGLPDTFSFGQIWGSRGRKALLFEDQLKAHQAERAPRPPAIQTYLKQSSHLQNRLKEEPTLTHSALGREIGLSRYEVIRTLNLLRLAPEIQRFILALPATPTRRFPVSKRNLRNLLRIQDPDRQTKAFKRLIASTPLANLWDHASSLG